MSNKDRFLAEISSFPAWRNNIERRKGEGGEREKRRDNGSWFTNTIRIAEAKPGRGARFGHRKSRGGVSSSFTRNEEC